MALVIWKAKNIGRLLIFTGVIFFLVIFLIAVLQNPENCNCSQKELSNTDTRHGSKFVQDGTKLKNNDDTFGAKYTMAIIVPFRNRLEELLHFAPHMHKYLSSKDIEYKIYVINQVDNLRFNRASLINIGYLMSHEECDYIAMHDVDLLPLNAQLNYTYPKHGPFHVAAPNLHPKYHYSSFIGGILLVNNNHFKLVNGMSNKYWGWGMEDDEFYMRIREMDLPVQRPTHVKTGLKTFKHVHDKAERPRDYKQYGDQKKSLRQRDRESGVDDVDFEFSYIRQIHIDGVAISFVGVELKCDVDKTVWCMHPEQLQDEQEDVQKVEDKHTTKEEERLGKIKKDIVDYQDEITEFLKNVKPVRKVPASELPKWMKVS